MLLLALVTLSTAVASDVDDTITNTNGGNLTVQSDTVDSVSDNLNDDNSNKEQSTESEMLSASSDEGNGLLSASSDEEKLTGTSGQLSDLIAYEYSYLELDDDYSLTYTVSISGKNDFVIDGKNHIIDGNGLCRIFNIDNTCINITFKNIVFKNAGNSAIYFAHLANDLYSNFTFENCTFIDNYAPMYGGAIRANFNNNRGLYGEINLINSKFIGNSAERGGGVVYARNANNKYTYIYVTNCTFTNNSVTTNNEGAISGGVFHTYNCVDLYIKSSIFTGNSAVGSGGVMRSSGVVDIDNCEFYSNEAGDDGGCIFMGNTVGTLTVTNSKFEDNYARRWGGVVMGYGYRFETCTFNNNKVNTSLSASGKSNTGRGGVMCSREGIASVIVDCNFTNNIAQEGGAICMEERAPGITISGSTFNNNQATLKGGALYTSVVNLATISTSTFESNSANYGGAVWSSNDDASKPNGRVIIQSSEFKSNTANIQGGALYLNTPSNEVVDSQFRLNTAPIAGAIYWNGNNGKVQGSTFESNLGLNGSSIYWAYDNGNVINSKFKDTPTSAGSVYWYGANGAISGSTFEGINPVYISKHATGVALTSNTQFSNSYDGSSVYLEGTASFDSNNFMNAIYNYGVIQSQTYVVTLNNNTLVTNVNSLPVFTRIEDDNGNPIKIKENMTIFYDSNNQLSTTFNHTDYISSVSNLAIGLHNFTASGYNSANFNNMALKNGAILYLVMNLTVNQTNYGEKVVFTTTLVNTTLNGTIGLDINEIHYDVPLVNGVAVLTLYNMAPNEYVVTATYLEYNQTLLTNITIDVQLRNSTINVTANNITYGGIVTININVTKGAAGTVFVFVDNKMYTVKLTNSVGQLNLVGLTGGEYNVFAVYNGDVNFNGNYNTTTFTVKKFNSTVTINATDVDFGQTAVIQVHLPSDANGTTVVYVDSTPYTFTKQPITVTIANLTTGNHTVRVLYDGNDKYLPNSNSTVFEVRKIQITPAITAPNIKVGENATITVDLKGATNATGMVLLTVNNMNYYVNANKTKATFIISNLPYGKYNVTATYLEDDIYYTATTNASFKVDYVEIDPTFTYSVDDDLNVIANVTVPSDANGDIIIEVDGKNYTSDIVKGKFSVPINGLEGGEYPVKIYFANDTKYLAVNKTDRIVLNKVKPTLHIDSEHIYVGDNATITVRLPSDATGNVTITINNNNYTKALVSGSAEFNVSGLPHGNYTVVANYAGDRKYLADVEDEVLIVRKVDPNPYSYIRVDDIFVGEIATFNITMPSDLTAKINLTVQGITHVVDIINGSGQINISDLKWGLPVPVHASFLGNDKYLGCERDYTRFSVHRITNYPINITATTNSTSANITVILPSDANGIGNITIDNRVFPVTYVNGKANVTVDGLVSGHQYVVDAHFAGDDKYTAGSASRTLNSNKTLDYNFTAAAKDIVVGQTAYINVYLPNITNGTITIRVPGRDSYTINVNETFVNGTYDLPVYNLAAGSYTCYVTYNGNDMYESSTRSGTLVVSKINTSPGINFNTTYVGQNLTIQVTLPSDSNGTVNITIDGKVYNATVVNGTAYVNVPGLAADTYEASLFYSGNEKYNNRTQKFPVTILKVRDFLFDLGTINIKVGDNETITIRLPSDIDVNVTITIPGTTYINKVIQLTNGTATFNATGLKVGRYNVTASIKGSAKYIDYSVTRYFTVSPIEDYLFKLQDVNTTIVRDNIIFVLNLPEDATGNATVSIFGQNYTGEVKNGVATIKVPTTAQGNYPFTISFVEEGKYVYKSHSGYAFVVKTNPNMNLVYNASVNVDDNVTITFVLDKDATGNVSVTSRGVTYTAKLVNGSANVTIEGYPVASAYSPHISYTGDDKYNLYSDTIKITAHKVSDYNITVNVSNITVDDVELVNISIPSDATEDVLVSGNFSNNIYSVKLNNGNATFIIKDLPAGTYFINIRYQGYQKYEDKNITKIFRVDKVVPPIAIEFVNNDTIVVRLPELANGLANITVGNGLIKTQINITNGVGSLNISGIRPGTYNVSATFLGGARYLQNSTSITITIPKIKDYILPITVKDITVGENATITIEAPYNATGKMNLTINGGSVIEVQIINGVATYNATKLAVGNYTVVVSYADDEYVYKTNSSKFQVNKIETVINKVITGNSTSITVNVNLTESVYGGNLTINIDGTPVVFKDITSNIINLTVPAIPGEHVVFIEYSGDENHTYKYDFSTIQTYRISDYSLTVDATDVITVLDNNTVIVTITKGIEGEVNIYINGELYEETAVINSTTGKATLVLDRLPSGNYTIGASFSSVYYELKENTTEFTVIKLNTTISINVTNITKDLTEIINVTVNKNATGYVEIFVNNVTFRVKVENGTAILTRSNLDDKVYNVTATYIGDDYFYSNTTNASFTVSKIPVNITITANNIVIGQEANFTITTSRPITDLVTVRIDNRNYTAVVYNGVGNLIVLGQNLGVHNVTVFYAGDNNYLPANDTINVTVHDKLPTSIVANVTNITVGDKVTIYVNVTGAQNGTVTIYMLGNPITANVVNGTANFTYSNLAARDYHFTVSYNENTYYKSSNTTGDFTVFKKLAPISATVTNATVGDVEYINVYLPENATGNILLSVNGSNYYSPVKDGVAKFNVTGLAIGNHTAFITFRGDDNYLSNTTEVNITTTKRDLTINITSNKPVIVIGHPVVFTIETSVNITEVVTVKIIDQVTGAEILSNNTFVENGKGTYTVYGLASGNYTAKVIFNGNSQYDAKTNNTTFRVSSKSPTSLNVSVANITLGEDAVIYVNVTDLDGNLINTGKVALIIAGRPQTKDVVDGKVNFTVTDLVARDYHVTATYLENNDYLSNSTSTDFTVFRKDSTIKINVTDINVGQNETIKINVTSGATGIVLIDIAGIQVYAILNNSYVEVLFDDLGIGEYNVTATYMGDGNYFNSTTNASFKVTKLDTSIIIKGSNITVVQTETFNITTSANITSVVFVEINGTNYTSFIENGKGTFTVPTALAEGNYTVYVYFPGNDKYGKVQNSTDITVSAKKPSQVTVNVTSITVGDKATIYVNVTEGTTGTVAISIAGNVYSVLLNNSRASITLENLTARNYHVSAIYLGDDYYLSSNGTADFVVNKKASQINVTATDTTVDNKTTISIEITNGTTGVVLIDINGTDYFANITNGVAKLVVNNLAVGNYTVNVSYNGDANYLASSNSTKFKVSKFNSEITVEVMGPEKVAQGSDVQIKVTGPKDVTGVATVIVRGDTGSKTYTVYINNGEGLLTISKPNVAHYTVSAVYQENYKYLSNYSNYDEFEVYANGSSLDVNTHNILVGENETIIITVAGDYDGQIVNITIDGTIKLTAALVYNATGNSSSLTYNYTGRLSSGIHQVDAAFTAQEGEKIITHSGSSTFIVSKNDSAVVISPISNIKVGENNTIELTLFPSDATGTVDVYVNGEKHTLNVTDLTLKLAGLSAGHYVVQAMYSGDDKYYSSSDEAEFDVFKNNITIKLEVKDIKVGETQYLNVTLESDAKGYVLIDINGTQFYAEIKDGVASVNITDFAIGSYDVTAVFIGDDKYYENSTTDRFDVTKLNTTIEIKSTNIIVGQTEVFTITTSANLTEVVYIEIDGVNYTAFIKDGKGNFSKSGLAVGPYTAYVYFPGNTKYGAVNNKTTFTVRAKTPTAINVTVADITVGENITVYVNATEGINGPVYVTIGGVAYTYDLVNGRVSFNVSGLAARDYVVSAFFMGNDEFELCNTTSNFTVHKKNTPISMNVSDINVGDTEIINVTVDSNATGNVLISIGSIHVYAELENGVASVNITGLSVGKHNVTVTYVGDNNYNPNATNSSFEVSKLTTSITIETNNVYVGQPVEFTIKTSANFTEVVTVTIGDKTYHTFVQNGTGSLVVYDLVADTYTATVKFPGNTQYDEAENHTDFEVYAKKSSEVTVNVESITVGENATVKVNITKGATGNVTIVIAGHEYTKAVDNATGEVTFEIKDLTARNYEVTAIYHGDVVYSGSSNKDTFTVSKLASKVDLEVENINVGSTEYINVTVTPGTTGVVLINISGTCYYAELKDSKANFTISGLSAGNYEAKVTYMGDAKYEGNVSSKTFIVQPEITLTPGENDGDKTPITVDVGDKNATGNVTVIIDGVPYDAKVENGTATVYVDGNNPGSKNATVIYTPEGKDPIEQNVSVDIPKVSEYPLDIEVTNVDKANGTATIKVQAPKDATGNATIKVGDQVIPVTLDENGTAIVTVNNIPVGSHDIDVTYNGDDKYVSKSNRTHVNMPINLPTVNVVDHLVRGWNSQFDYEAVFTNEFGEVLVNTTVQFIVNGKTYSVKTETHGIAKLSETLPIGEYTVTSVNPVTGEKVTKKLSIVKRIIQNKDLTMDFKDGSHWDVLVIGDDGKPVGEGEIIDIYVNTIHYVAKTDKNGYAKLAINLNPKSYKISAEYKKYKVINKLKVKQTFKLVKKIVSVKKGKKLVLQAKLKWSNGKPIKGKVIKFKFKDKTYKAKTNSKGIAKVTIKPKVTKKLKKGKKYAYSAKYITNNLKGKVKVR
ncbi:Ig-like domain repeat protein [uncultured Methanobrevibacter sp.]|uniref:Ig-like domain repeat protein n=1 Tax=uncultured Methanobrevibacter sp. TaxID=253161 RepID=UPI0025CFDEFE|nr:Ig-like domain repeat protein [uncultured Methanobrevibacter sp.]